LTNAEVVTILRIAWSFNLAGQPIANALVNLFSYPTGYALTDAQGLFQISNVYEGLSEIQIEAPGMSLIDI